MKRIERTLSIILLVIISFSNVSTPFAYAAETIVAKIPPPAKSSTTPVVPPKFKQPDNGSVLGASTSLLVVGSGGADIQTSASKRVPIRVQQLTQRVYQTDEDVTVSVLNPDNDPFTTSVTDSTGVPANVPITQSNDGTTTTVQLAPSNVIKPGQYTLKITDDQGNITTQDFSWGVLALNTDKTMYHPGEQADISLAVLDDKGSMVCDADLQLRVTSSALGVDDMLSTDASESANLIIVHPQCDQHDFSLQPDYEAHYTFAKAGNYNLQLTATTQNGTHTITDTVPVTNDIPFDVQRISATRIYPLDTYPMTMNIKADRDFSGTVTETVPEDFVITPATESAVPVSSYSNLQTVYLNSNDPAARLQQAITASGSGGLVMPFHGYYPITQGFGAQMTDPTLQAFYTQYGLAGHDGVDFGVPMNTPLYAVDNGTVVWSGPGDYGVTIIIQHSWGQSYYGHLSTTAVKVGDQVTKGELIGYSGESGEATGPHLHFGVRPNNPDMKNGYYGKVDPLPYLPYNNQQPQDLSTLNPTLAQAAATQTVLSASTSATPSPTDTPTPDASSSAAVSPTITQTPPAALSETPTASAAVSESPTMIPSPTVEVQQTIGVSNTPPANTNFTLLDKQILFNEQLANSSQTEQVKVLTWNVNLKKGQSTSIGYDYQAPHVSPQFYLLGPMQFYQNGSDKVVFQEQRQWEVASDDVGIEWYSNNTGNKWNGYSWQYRKKITINALPVVTPTLDSQSAVQSINNSTSPITWTHTMVGSAGCLLIVAVSVYITGASTVHDVDSNGTQSLTKLSPEASITSPTNDRSQIWYLITPPTGSNAISVSFGGVSTQAVAGSVAFCNVNTSSPFGTGVANTGQSADTGSLSITTSANQVVVDSFGFQGNAGAWNVDSTGQNLVFSSDPVQGLGISYKTSSVGTTTMEWNGGPPGPTPPQDTWADVAVPINGATNSLPNFPVLVSTSSDTNLSNYAQSSGNDILFTDSTGETLLPYEIESYNSGTLVAWVTPTSGLSSSSSTIIYMYYGNPSSTGNTTTNVHNTWNSNYLAVYHLGPTTPGGSTLSGNDSTSNAMNGTTTGACSTGPTYTASGEIDGAGVFGTGGGTPHQLGCYILPTSGSLATSYSTVTVSGWVDILHNATYNTVIFDTWSTGAGNGWNLYLDNGDVYFGVSKSAGPTQFNADYSSNLSNSTWHYLVGTYDGTTARLYIDGVQQATTTTGSSITFSSPVNIQLGGSGGPNMYGDIDDTRVSKIAYSAAWIAAEYSNQSAPGSFETLANQETDIYAPTMAQVMRHGEWFSAEGAVQPFVF